MPTTTTTADPQELHAGMLALVLDALANGSAEAQRIGRKLAAGRLAIAWTCPELPWLALRSTSGTEQLAAVVEALGAQAAAYSDDGLHISAGDCYWLAAKLQGGALQVVSADRIAAARGHAYA